MKLKKKILYIGDPESTVGLFISGAIDTAKKEDAMIIGDLRGTKIIITKFTQLDDGIARYRKNVERRARIRE